jgi:hypothetical protein
LESPDFFIALFMPRLYRTVTFRNAAAAAAILVLLLLVVRETGIVNVDFYCTYANYHADTRVGQSYTAMECDSAKLESIPHENLTKVPLVVLYDDDTLINRQGYGPEIVLTIEELATGPIWLPLYKPGNLEARMSCVYRGGCTKRIGPYIRSVDLRLNGNIYVTGTADIVGICSYRTSRELLKQAVANMALQEINLRLQELEILFEAPPWRVSN